MSEAFDWSRVLKTDADPAKAAAKEGLAINPVNGEPILENKTPLEVVPGGAAEKSSDKEPEKADKPDKAERAAEKAAERAAKVEAAANAEPSTRTVDVLPKAPPKTLEEIQAEYANKDLFAPKSTTSESEPKPTETEAKSAKETKAVFDRNLTAAESAAPELEKAKAISEAEVDALAESEVAVEANVSLKFEISDSTEEPALETAVADVATEFLAEEAASPEFEATEGIPFIDLKPKDGNEEETTSESPSHEALEKTELEVTEDEDEAFTLVEEPTMALNDAFKPDDSGFEEFAPTLSLSEAPTEDKANIFSMPTETHLKDDIFGRKDLNDELKPDMSKHYRPAELPENIYDIPLSSNKFDVGNEIAALSDEVEVLEDVTAIQDVHLDDILRCAIERKASDVHFTVGLPPMARIDGEVAPLPFSICEAADTRRIVYDVLTDENVQKFEQTHELDFGYGVSGLGRFRFNVYMQRGSVAGALRAIPTKIPSFEDLGLPPVIRDISKRSSGLVLVTGPTGSGKSTTIASMIDDINMQRTNHIITIEDPIEYLHPHKKCMVNQRELHGDTYSFHNALRAILREDPDIILVGELRDLETIEAALTLAETGHLVFGTLHTRNAPSTIDRVIDVFPSDQQDQIRVLLGNTLEGVVSQQLLPRLGGGRCAAIEIMMGTPAIKNLIREGKTHQMYSVLETSSNIGMQTMDASLSTLFRNGYCSYDECMMRAVDKETFARLAKGG